MTGPSESSAVPLDSLRLYGIPRRAMNHIENNFRRFRAGFPLGSVTAIALLVFMEGDRPQCEPLKSIIYNRKNKT